MFNGIIGSVGTLQETRDNNGDKTFFIRLQGDELERLVPGDSVAVNGVCLTVSAINNGLIEMDVSVETLSRTSFNEYDKGCRVNIEFAMQLVDRLNGHLVTGHVDGTGVIVSREQDVNSIRFVIRIPGELSRYVCEKGSICIDGVSLTVNQVKDDQIGINIIPYTAANTIFDDYTPGNRVNIEVDILARYLESLLDSRQ